ncbi:mediator of RNA polymerase II transcription subunit 30 [Microplitis demolitor]|uniref:mediator of RNA polymerase II transcription subunit 30 n=1 Tax=Microplitis demolitor TaxID=69319 RepID=UPI00235B5C31|nr:mediator of RNA polymerase II transcription subunit 30 [Microplitis demolitor]XP_008553128.2 mediator of RNA polymerase II transcription subunit 30 [Microplitis demolitor]
MAGQQPSFPSGFPAPQQQAMINQFGGGQMVPELMGPQQGGMPGGLVNPQQFGGNVGGNVGAVGPNPMGIPTAQQVMTQQRQQLAQQTLMQQQLQQMQQQQMQMQQQQQQTAHVPQSSQAANQVQTPQTPVPQVQPQIQQQQPQPPQQPAQQQPQQKQQFNTATLCKLGQEMVHDIVNRTLELFQILKTIQPPNGTQQGATVANERQKKMLNQLQANALFFKRIRMVYNACNENCQLQGMEYTHIESLIPLKEEWDMKSEEKKTSEAYRHACEERNELIEQVTAKNRHLKEIIDHIRLIISEVNIMLHMRRS